ncbi:hypothetical protein DM860_015772 [Cuscuta australis]|uniref:NADH:ubiquinone oxidoreductase intermediate-associated protein 30 domain-containing protein n=1 Tax=Cuscuta australis TaxID=267555 RepID=A0A328DY17_9ASTE|nr:hypothetical protein DM860_015772 [Cuscuta australis]
MSINELLASCSAVSTIPSVCVLLEFICSYCTMTKFQLKFTILLYAIVTLDSYLNISTIDNVSGRSSASLEIKSTSNGSTSVGIFSGNLSKDVAEGSTWNMTRSGFCGMRSKKFDGFIDLDAYDTIAVKLKGDGRCYISTIYTQNWVNSPGQEEDNSWQAFVVVPKDNWYIAKIPLSRYVPTWRGNIINAKMEMNPSRVLGMSLSVNAEGGVPGAESGPGDFHVEIDWIKAMRTG